jgi:type IV pilus assembly protein PilM
MIKLTTTKQPTSIVGLDIETGSIAATEVKVNGSNSIARTAIVPLEPGVVSEGEVRDGEALVRALRSLFSENKLGKNVRLGVANQRVVVRTLRLPLIEDEDEIDTAVRFQAQDQIPMPLEHAVLDHQVIARETGTEGDRHMDVIAVAARRDMVTSLAQALNKAGLRSVGIDLSAFGMIRALRSEAGPADYQNENGEGELPVPATLYCYLGDITNLAVARGGICLFTRIAPFGIETIAASVAEREKMPLEDARDWLIEVGLDEPVDSFEDDRKQAETARKALEDGSSKLIDELRVSMEFYGAQEGAPAIEQVVVCGPGSTIPGLPERIQQGLGLGIESQSPAALSHLDDEDAARLTISYGLALGD